VSPLITSTSFDEGSSWQIYAGLFTGKERYKRNNKGIDLEDQEKDERERLDNFAQWLVDEDGE
jgi:HIV Tat-specific factor 1